MAADMIPRIRFGKPDIAEMKRGGYAAVDMHVHSNHSDAVPSVRKILKYARQRGIGVAITDHNEISGVREIHGYQPDALVIPGIELDCAEGPHILLYFYSCNDLADFFDRHIRERRVGARYTKSFLATDEILTLAEGYSCLKVAAHPFGYFFLDRGILKCDARGLLPGIVDRLDGIEVICGGMTRGVNRMAIEYADSRHVPITGGSDAHIQSEVGRVVTGVRAESVGDFLDGIRRCESVVTGSCSGIASRVATGSVIGYHYLPYSVKALHSGMGSHAGRIMHSMKRFFRPK